ncbi:MAG TPA: SpoIID/LytB domain-containing protein [Blastocatellia bacterium]|nr:SpoIID/LytB domain-containing protein [Blastocatellia bacterium]
MFSCLIKLGLLVALLSSCAAHQAQPTANSSQSVPTLSESELDAALQKIAEDSLGEREGAIVVIDPQNGRIRAVVNPRLAFEQTFPPGSAIKPFTALAALRSGVIDREIRHQCQTRYAREGFEIVCSHPASNSPFNLSQALAYSCNNFFARVGERLSEGAFNSTLSAFGFGEKTGVNSNESAGELPRRDWSVRDALGESDHLLVTPVQLITAYAALVNGGHLYRPQRSTDHSLIAQERLRLNIAPEHRAALIEGMRGSVKYGTASKSGLGSAPFYVFGKTGTSTSSVRWRTQGWFVGFAAEKSPVGPPRAEQVKLVALVFLKRAHGSQAAEVAKPIFDCGLRIADCGLQKAGERVGEEEKGRECEAGLLRASALSQRDCGGNDLEMTPASFPLDVPNEKNPQSAIRNPQSVDPQSAIHNPQSSDPQSAIRIPQSIKIHSVSENLTRETPLEDYLTGVLAAESSVENEVEALKAQAIVSRTFALKNLGRHAREGYDFCSTTHCQRYVFPKTKGAVNAAARRAVEETAGVILSDPLSGKTGAGGAERVVDAYFHASCGGMTANIETLWGSAAPSYLRGVRDDFCATSPHRRWTQHIPADRLAKALQSDERANAGAQIVSITVTKRDATGRAEIVAIEGARRRLVRGWDFKIIVGRSLGWQVIKSSRFVVTRAGNNFVFRGGGFGHGLGLCQEGAHVAARRGMSHRQILNHYFPGTRLTSINSSVSDLTDGSSVAFTKAALGSAQTVGLMMRSPIRLQKSKTAILSSEHFRATYPASAATQSVEYALRALENARADLLRRLEAASLRLAEKGPYDVVIHATTADFIAATGQSGWAAGATHGKRIELQPLSLLERRGILNATLRHEMTHAAIEALSDGRAPRWMAEGVAIYVAGEAAKLPRIEKKDRLSRDELERKLAQPTSVVESRKLYAMAYHEIRAMIEAEGEAGVWRRLARGTAPKQAFDPTRDRLLASAVLYISFG